MKPLQLLVLFAVALGASAQESPSNSSVVPSLPSSQSTLPSSTPSSISSTPAPSSPSSTPPPSTTVSLIPSQTVSTAPDGGVATVNVTLTSTLPLSSSPSQTPADNNKKDDDDSPGLSTGGIAGLAAAGGVAVLCLAGFLIWKLTRKKGGEFDDNEAIKWPELNAHGEGGDTHAMPVHNTGRSGFDTAGDLSRVPSAANTYNASSTDFHSSNEDPYAVPPLPHMNPGQPYRDDPNAMNTASYYDPYHGPVPQTFNEANGPPPQEWGGNEAIPMTQMAGRASPGPQMAYAGAGRTPSPGPQMAYGRSASPGPQQLYGRGSPAPGQMYGGRASPGPQAAYAGAGRTPSPGPHQAYGGGGYGGM
ncbi:hypothetical protein MIND_00266900 [Mycena indigotica]|uniref:Uncharacterized protein n=1 Tax=Mycena indigotica TaxID=2126181 RepID=A0A8H6T5M3_9AGAR|nr:uncharacterized protein MIND_00266900 [Mycena indigotica]KAF7312530.1 hypothetical protein MIND_00266900 [Mycena indigotica]